MSDYLSNLAARSLGQADVVRPRPVPLFAPPPRSAGWPPVEQADDLEVMDHHEQSPADPRAPAFQVIAPHADPHAPPPPTVPSFAPPIGWSQPAPPVVRAARLPAAEIAAPPLLASESLHRQAPAPAAERLIVERLIAPAPAAERVIIERPIASAPARAAAHAETAPITSVVERIVTPAVQPAATTAVPQIQPPIAAAAQVVAQPPSAPAQIIVKPRIIPAPVAPAPPPAPVQPAPALPEPAPIIHVTIGRIEVRATSPAAQPARGARSAGPAMSLDEYLRTRNGGSR